LMLNNAISQDFEAASYFWQSYQYPRSALWSIDSHGWHSRRSRRLCRLIWTTPILKCFKINHLHMKKWQVNSIDWCYYQRIDSQPGFKSFNTFNYPCWTV
jgi:hypothetical protein